MTTKSSTRRREILLAALDCFIQHGVEATSIEMIREGSGASVGSLYHHFGNKEGIAGELYLEGLRDFRESLSQALAGADTLEGLIRHIVYANVDWICANPNWARFIFTYRRVLKADNRADALEADTHTMQQALFSRLSALLPANKTLVLSPDVCHSLIIGPTHDYARIWLEGRRQQPLSELREVLAEAAWRSLGVCLG